MSVMSKIVNLCEYSTDVQSFSKANILGAVYVVLSVEKWAFFYFLIILNVTSI